MDISEFIISVVVGVSLAAVATCIVVIIINLIERKRSNGRYRKAVEAHRTGAGGGAPAGSYARGGAIGGTGPGMNPLDRYRLEFDRQRLAMLTSGKLNVPLPSTPTPTPTPAKPAGGEFSGVEFAAGVVTGARSFKVDKLGRLIGITYPSVWMPGENHAKCLIRTVSSYALMYGTGDSVRTSERPDEHSMTTCGHGFYAYYDGSNDYYSEGYVSGVVEGYGESVIGTRGFRASKARIVALHIPADVPTVTRNLIARNYPDVPRFDTFDAMVSAFPTDDGGKGLNPETDPDFWTRQA